VVLSLVLGYLFAVRLPPALGVELRWGAAGLTLASGLAAGVEYALLRWRLRPRLGETSIPAGFLVRVWVASALGAASAWLLREALPVQHPILGAIFLLGTFGLVYFGVTTAAGLPEARRVTGRVWRRRSTGER
jgi:putative peptidoglycan lipid II flippase